MKVEKLEATIKRSRAACLLDKTPRTLARYEQLGLLTPIKINCRSVVYRLVEVQGILNGGANIAGKVSEMTASRSTGGTFIACPPQNLKVGKANRGGAK